MATKIGMTKLNEMEIAVLGDAASICIGAGKLGVAEQLNEIIRQSKGA